MEGMDVPVLIFKAKIERIEMQNEKGEAHRDREKTEAHPNQSTTQNKTRTAQLVRTVRTQTRESGRLPSDAEFYS